MPRAAFYLLWAKLKQGLPFAGYVKNMAKDGRYYRVFVLAVSAGPQRYLSVRFKPTTALRGTHALREKIGAITQCTEVINTRISMAHLQMEMLRFFQKEAAARQTPPWPGSGKSSPR